MWVNGKNLLSCHKNPYVKLCGISIYVVWFLKQPQLILDSAHNQSTTVAPPAVKIEVDDALAEEAEAEDEVSVTTTQDSRSSHGNWKNGAGTRMEKNLYTFSASAGQQLKKDLLGISKPWVLVFFISGIFFVVRFLLIL